MKQFLEKVRTAQRQSLPKQIIATTGVVLLGFALGVLQKWMDGSSDNLFPVWMQQLEIILDAWQYGFYWRPLFLCIPNLH